MKACADVVVLCDSNVFSFDTVYTDLENGIDCESLPFGKYRLVLIAELIDGRTNNVSEYDFEVVNRCSSVRLVDDRLQLECGDISLLYPIIEPSTATYPTLFHYFSSDEDIVTIDENGFLQAQNKSGTAIVTVYSWDWYASTLCEITVYDAETQEDCPVSVEVWSNAGSENQGHYHQYGRSEEFTGRITSTVAIKEIRSKVVYRCGDNDGQPAYDCSQATFVGDANTYSINIGSSVLNTRLKFGKMPCAPLRLFLYAELIDGSIYQIYKYDFEIVEKCTAITLNRYDKILPFDSTFQIIPSVSPSNAKYHEWRLVFPATQAVKHKNQQDVKLLGHGPFLDLNDPDFHEHTSYEDARYHMNLFDDKDADLYDRIELYRRDYTGYTDILLETRQINQHSA